MSNELKTLFSDSVKLMIGEKEIVINTIKLYQITDLIDIFDVVQTELKKLPKSKKADEKVDLKPVIMNVAKSNMDTFFKLIAECTNLSKDEVGNLNIAASILIVEKIVEVNWDFLEGYILPAINKASETMKKLTAKSPGQG